MRRDNKRVSKIQEARTARDFGGRTTPASGSQWHSKGDVKTNNWLIECKTTSKLSYSLKAETWHKIWTEAISEGRDPIMVLDFETEGVSLVVMSKEDFLGIVNMGDYRELNESIGIKA